MAGDNMDIEVAEKQLKSLDHSEQHYFNRQVSLKLWSFPQSHTVANYCALVITTMVREIIWDDLPQCNLANHCDPAIRHP
jgi:hypothetical protein